MNTILTGAVAALLVLAPAWAGDVDIAGAVNNPLHLTPGALRAMPATEVTVAKSADSDMPAGTFRGVLLTKLLARAVLRDKPGKHSFLQHSMLVTGRDGYAVALAIGEIEPGMEGKSVLLAYDVDGRPFRDGLHLVVPGDKQGARQVRDVVRIEVQ
jgi:DMSO/TMAO reductase YedYZ molybdopterin-dependent catalytic subunit